MLVTSLYIIVQFMRIWSKKIGKERTNFQQLQMKSPQFERLKWNEAKEW